jgi:uncharacterized cupredoxin-like copper-binding protein
LRRIPIALIALGLLAFGLAACGSDSSSSGTSTPAASADADADEDATAAPAATGPADETIQVSAPADGSLKFDPGTLKAKAGTVEFDFSNPAQVEHNLCVRSASGDELGCSSDVEGDSTSLTVDLEPGKYVVYCGEPGHEEGGMTDTLTVT